jgi:hypothetical protein
MICCIYFFQITNIKYQLCYTKDNAKKLFIIFAKIMKFAAISSKFSISNDVLFSLHSEIKDLLNFSEKHRHHSTALLFDGDRHIKAVKKMFDSLVRYQFDAKKLESKIRESIQRLNLLFHWLSDFESHDRELYRSLSLFIEKLGTLLPAEASIQLLLFSTDAVEDTPEKKRVLPGFFAWKKQKCRARLVFDIEELPFVRPRSPFQQLSLSLWGTPAPQELLTISLRQARRLARALGLPQKQDGQDLNLRQFVEQFQQQWCENASKVKAAMAAL